MTATTAIVVFAFIQLTSGITVRWIGVLLTTLPGILFLMRAMLFKRMARSSHRLPLILGMGVLGLGVVFYRYLVLGDSALEPLTLAGVGLGLFISYDFWYSRLRRSPDDLILGQRLPEFIVFDLEGTEVRSSELHGHFHLLLFYRGNWCPICMAQIKEVASHYRQLAERGVKVLLISPQPDEHSRRLAQKADAPMTFLEDRSNAAARSLGIADRWGLPSGMQMLGYSAETVLPTVVLTDPDGTIVWFDKTDNYRIRPEPDTFLRVLERIQTDDNRDETDIIGGNIAQRVRLEQTDRTFRSVT